ncbi:MAG: lipopolysaccharide biosynthesis protein [Candidatus Omnitrophica bacterium]|nr:lipopolysaccharide biosynthesis protein [Candidatus Omnitrophota bacterium]
MNPDEIHLDDGPSLKMRTARSIKWSTFNEIMFKLSSLVVTIFLARMLEKSDFGLYALAFVVIDGMGLFKSMGFDKALIQRKTDIEKAANTAFMIIPSLGILLYLILLLVIPLIAKFYPEADGIDNILRALGLFFIIFTLSKVPVTLLEKEIKFDVLAKLEMTSQIFYSVIALTLAFQGFGVWSLVIAYLTMNIIRCILYWKNVSWRPKFEFDRDIAIEMFHFGKYIFLGGFIWFVLSNFDKMVIPKILDISTLALYAIAMNLADIPSSFVGAKVSHVLFPTYSKLQGNMYDLAHAFVRVFKLIFMICAPISIGLLLMGKDFLHIAYGEKWIEAAPILHILALYGLSNAMGYPKAPVLLSLNKPKLTFQLSALRAAMIFIFVIPAGKLFGVCGIAWVVLITSVILFYIGFIIINKFLNISRAQIKNMLRSTSIAILVMSVVILCMQKISGVFNFHEIVRFLICFISGSSSYLLTLWLLEKDFILEVKDLALKA